jgi:hypothetical protein
MLSHARSVLSSSISHPHKKQDFQKRGQKRHMHHHLENFNHVFSSWLLATIIGIYSFFGTTLFMESYGASLTPTIVTPSQVT